MSPSDPPTSINEVNRSAYDSTTHCIAVTVAPRLDCSAGNARLTTVPSMNAMLEPRMVAARIHGADFGEGCPMDLQATPNRKMLWSKLRRSPLLVRRGGCGEAADGVVGQVSNDKILRSRTTTP